jgi:hypothetical protein
MSDERDTAYVDICPVCGGQNESGITDCHWCGYPAGVDWETVEIDLDTDLILRTIIPAQPKEMP